jgi:hypothetical protein
MTLKHCQAEIVGLWTRWDQENRMLRVIARNDRSGIGVAGEQAKNWRWLQGQLKDLEAAHGFRTFSEALAALLLGDDREPAEGDG